MRAAAALFPAVSLTLAACGPKQLALPDDPIDRAATCGVVAVAKARKDVNTIQGPLPFDAQLGVIHYALLAGAGDKGFSQEEAAAVAKRMPELADTVTAGKWEALEPACAEAFPASAPKAPPTLPGPKAEQQLGCFMLADFLRTALASQDANYGDQLSTLGALRRSLDTKLGARFAAKGQSDADAQKSARDTALGDMARAGPPAPMLKLCLAQFPPPKTAL